MSQPFLLTFYLAISTLFHKQYDSSSILHNHFPSCAVFISLRALALDLRPAFSCKQNSCQLSGVCFWSPYAAKESPTATFLLVWPDSGYLRRDIKYKGRFAGADRIRVILPLRERYLAFQEANFFSIFSTAGFHRDLGTMDVHKGRPR